MLAVYLLWLKQTFYLDDFFMKLGIKKIHENEWQVHIGCAKVKLDRFSIELLNITLDHLAALESGQSHSILTSYVLLAEKMLKLDTTGVQTLVHEVNNQDLLKLLQVANNQPLTDYVVANVGGILSKQLRADLSKAAMPGVEDAKEAIQRVIETMFQLEADGRIEFETDNQRYI